jgi:hypothetical protein
MLHSDHHRRGHSCGTRTTDCHANGMTAAPLVWSAPAGNGPGASAPEAGTGIVTGDMPPNVGAGAGAAVEGSPVGAGAAWCRWCFGCPHFEPFAVTITSIRSRNANKPLDNINAIVAF